MDVDKASEVSFAMPCHCAVPKKWHVTDILERPKLPNVSIAPRQSKKQIQKAAYSQASLEVPAAVRSLPASKQPLAFTFEKDDGGLQWMQKQDACMPADSVQSINCQVSEEPQLPPSHERL